MPMPKTSPVGGDKKPTGTHPKDPGGTQVYLPPVPNAPAPIGNKGRGALDRI